MHFLRCCLVLFIPIFILLLLGGYLVCQMGKTDWKYPYGSDDIWLSAYHELVISGAEIRLYQDGSFQYASIGLGFTEYFNGTYSKTGDSIRLHYLSEAPSPADTLLFRSDRHLEFIQPNKELPYLFYLDSRFIRDSVNAPNF